MGAPLFCENFNKISALFVQKFQNFKILTSLSILEIIIINHKTNDSFILFRHKNFKIAQNTLLKDIL